MAKMGFFPGSLGFSNLKYDAKSAERVEQQLLVHLRVQIAHKQVRADVHHLLVGRCFVY